MRDAPAVGIDQLDIDVHLVELPVARQKRQLKRNITTARCASPRVAVSQALPLHARGRLYLDLAASSARRTILFQRLVRLAVEDDAPLIQKYAACAQRLD